MVLGSISIAAIAKGFAVFLRDDCSFHLRRNCRLNRRQVLPPIMNDIYVILLWLARKCMPFMGKSQETQQLAVGMSRKCGFGSYRPYYGFFLGRTPQLAAEFFTSADLIYGLIIGGL
jgi:hypothetical protein